MKKQTNKGFAMCAEKFNLLAPKMVQKYQISVGGKDVFFT